jgi:hypothetical protein
MCLSKESGSWQDKAEYATYRLPFGLRIVVSDGEVEKWRRWQKKQRTEGKFARYSCGGTRTITLGWASHVAAMLPGRSVGWITAQWTDHSAAQACTK